MRHVDFIRNVLCMFRGIVFDTLAGCNIYHIPFFYVKIQEIRMMKKGGLETADNGRGLLLLYIMH